jgi:propanol-preferring alcohol dehydrogenase
LASLVGLNLCWRIGGSEENPSQERVPWRSAGARFKSLSVANLTRSDGQEFFDIASQAGIVTGTFSYPLARANEALSDLRTGRLQGAAVLVP